MSSPLGNALIGQSGGPTAVINQSLIGVLEAAVADPRIGSVYGALHGVKGILEGDLIDLTQQDPAEFDRIAATPGAALRSVRKKPAAEEAERVVEALDAHDVRFLFYIGGNDSAETALLLLDAARARGQQLQVIHVPKTVDNDLMETDHCPGFGSAARFVALAHQGDDMDNRSLPGVKINVIMGRHAGWLTAASALARHDEGSGPHLVYVPERVFDMDAFLEDVAGSMERHGRCIISVSEGIHRADGTLIGAGEERDSHGNVQLSGSGALGDLLSMRIKAALGKSTRVRADTFGYLQRSYPGTVSDQDALEAREVGRRGVAYALGDDRPSGSVVIRRAAGDVYAPEYALAPLENLAQKTRVLPEEFLRGNNDVAPAFIDWLRPLAGALPQPGLLRCPPVGARVSS